LPRMRLLELPDPGAHRDTTCCRQEPLRSPQGPLQGAEAEHRVAKQAGELPNRPARTPNPVVKQSLLKKSPPGGNKTSTLLLISASLAVRRRMSRSRTVSAAPLRAYSSPTSYSPEHSRIWKSLLVRFRC
jgi:hypothetical protein